MHAAVHVVNKVAELLSTLSAYTLNATRTDIRYKTTATTVAKAKVTSKMTIEKLNIVTGTRIFQKGTCGSIVLVTIFTCLRLTCAKRAKYCGLGCSSCTSKPVKSQRCVISAEYRFHISRNNVAGRTMMIIR